MTILTVDYKEELRKLDSHLIKMREEAIKDVMESVQNMRANYCMLHTPSMWAFIGLYYYYTFTTG